ncbi:hypothetical protein EP7_004267 [Isosphaeraceae bacterium EP7]
MDPCALRLVDLGRILPVFTADQADPLLQEPARGAIIRAMKYGLLACSRAIVSRPTPLLMPLFSTHPEAPIPSCLGQWSYALGERHVNAPRDTEFYHLTIKGANLIGCPPPKLNKPFEISHDLMLPQVYLASREIDPGSVIGWVSDKFYTARRRRRIRNFAPDIVALHPSGYPVRAIEYGGKSYSANRLRKMISACRAAGLCLEVW